MFIVKYCFKFHFREKMEAEQEKETRMQQFRTVGHNHSHDSAIDADLQEWETEILDIDLVSCSREFCN
jgi:hypothetical protein